MRTLFLLLVFANLVFFAWAGGYFGGTDTEREPQRINQQLNPAKLKVVSITPSEDPPAAEACRAVTGLRLADGQKLLSLLGQQLQGANAQLIRPNVTEAWDIAITALANRNIAETKVAELKKLGITDVRLIENAKTGDYSLLLGSDNTKADADDRLQGLVKKGVKSARVIQRVAPDEVSIQIRGSSANLSKLPDLTRGFANSRISDCPTN